MQLSQTQFYNVKFPNDFAIFRVTCSHQTLFDYSFNY